jgi:hypothetical protein
VKTLWSGSQQGKYISLFFKVSRLSLQSTLPPKHWVVGEIMLKSQEARGVKLAVHLCLVAGLGMSDVTPPFYCMSSWHLYKQSQLQFSQDIMLNYTSTGRKLLRKHFHLPIITNFQNWCTNEMQNT